MRRFYPYLQSPYNLDYNDQEKKANFFHKVDSMLVQKQYVRITLLSWDEEPLKEIQGELTSGSITKDGSSSVRRTCNFSASVNGGEYTVEDSEMDFAINKKVFIEIGVKNYTDEYREYPILWFPQGVFFIASFNCSSTATSAVVINLTLRDKMAMLNGEVGGTFPATTILDEMDTQAPSGEYITEKVLIYNIIQEVVNHFGGEDLNNIIIEDVDLQIRQVMKWIGDTPLYLISQGSDQSADGAVTVGGNTTLIAQLEEPGDEDELYGTYYKGDDVGYIYTDFVYPSELVASPGDTVAGVLETIKSTLGNYEFFYDEYGIFHFREIKNYMNTTQGKVLLSSMGKNDYLIETMLGKSVYTFSDDCNLISVASNPKYENIKNDYIIHGLRKMTQTDISYPVRYHLAIDSKPTHTAKDDNGNAVYSVSENFLTYDEVESSMRVGCFPLFNTDNIEQWPPEVGNFNIVYAVESSFLIDGAKAAKDRDIKDIEATEMPDEEKQRKIEQVENNYIEYLKSINATENGVSFVYWDNNVYKQVENPTFYGKYYTYDWRTELYVQGLRAKNLGTDQGYYFAELASGWTTIYDIDKHEFIGLSDDDGKFYNSSLTDGNYFLDFIDPATSSLGEFSVKNIGRRTTVYNNEDVNCLFAPEIPNVVFVNRDDDDADKQMEYLESIGELPSKVRANIYNSFMIGGYKNSAFDQIKYELYLHTNYQKTVNISAIPAFYLEPNTRITLNDRTTNTYGDFMTQTISISFGSAPMSVSCSEITERF